MKPYGVRREDVFCCPGHDTFPWDTYRNRRSKKAQTRDTKIAHRLARARIKASVHKAAEYGDDAEVFFDGV
ncbi:MAG: hypothetical protein HQL76_06210 [Magnetococcales bacterium]|nr:hypothetical protein [Magnetococcales bacterium]